MRKGYYLPFGYMGWVQSLSSYILFATEKEYEEFLEEEENEN